MSAASLIRVKFRRPRGMNTQGRTAYNQLKDLITTRLTMGLRDFQGYILETPVYTGKTLVNFRWSIGSPQESSRPAISEPSLPGKTSVLPLGSEPRRQANARVVQEEFDAVILAIQANPFQDIYLNNNLAHFSDVEFGVYAREGGKSRTPPGGMTRRGEVALEYALTGVGRRVA